MFSFKKKQTSAAVAAESVHGKLPVSETRSWRFNVNWRIALVVASLAIIVAGSLGAAGYFYNEYKKLSQKMLSPADELSDVVEKVSRIVELPEGENPTLATVSDVSKLSGQKFFEKAQNGDKVLIYTQASIAYLFRPMTGKVINVSQLDVKNDTAQEDLQTNDQSVPEQISSETTGQSVAGDKTEELSLESETIETSPDEKSSIVKIALYNGSVKVGVTNSFENEIVSKFENIEVVMKEKAAKNDYQGNFVVDLSGKNSELAQKLIDTFNGVIGALPDGEIKPEADILVIVGSK